MGAWDVSFHALRFPGDDDMACGRKAIYELAEFAIRSLCVQACRLWAWSERP